MPLVSRIVASLVVLLLALGGPACAPGAEARPAAGLVLPCHGDTPGTPDEAAGETPAGVPAPPSCLRCPLCATVVPQPPVPASSGQRVAFGCYGPVAFVPPAAPAFAPPTPPPQR